MKEKRILFLLLMAAVFFIGCGAENPEANGNLPVESRLEENTYAEDALLQKEEKISLVENNEEDDIRANEDIMLMAPPVITLTDTLSSTYALFEVSPGNYSWNFEFDGEMTGVIACGMHPLDEAERETLKIPQYKNMDRVSFIVGTVVAPDRLIVREWDAADMGNTDAEEISVITFYGPDLLLDLEAGRVYELTAVWEEKNAQVRGFFGEAGYIFVTE